jgi:hypothetical protein
MTRDGTSRRGRIAIAQGLVGRGMFPTYYYVYWLIMRFAPHRFSVFLHRRSASFRRWWGPM